MNILYCLLISVLVTGCGGIGASVKNNNKTSNLESHIIKDTQACNNKNNEWKTLTNAYHIAERSIDNLNSITFLSLFTDIGDVVLYYKNATSSIQHRPDDAMDILVKNISKKDATIDYYTHQGFLIQANKVFFNSGYYYVQADDLCYRGEFPKSNSVKDEDVYKNVKLVIN